MRRHLNPTFGLGLDRAFGLGAGEVDPQTAAYTETAALNGTSYRRVEPSHRSWVATLLSEFEVAGEQLDLPGKTAPISAFELSRAPQTSDPFSVDQARASHGPVVAYVGNPITQQELTVLSSSSVRNVIETVAELSASFPQANYDASDLVFLYDGAGDQPGDGEKAGLLEKADRITGGLRLGALIGGSAALTFLGWYATKE